MATPLRPALSPSPATGQEEIRRQNLGAVLRYIHVHGPTSRAELTGRLGLNRSTIGALAADLVALGLVVEEVPTIARRAGRPSLVVSPRPERVWVRAVSVEPEQLRAARIGLGGLILDRREAPRPRGAAPPDTAAELASLIRATERDLDSDALCAGGAVAIFDTARRSDATGENKALAAALDDALRPAGPDRPGFVTADLAGAAAVAVHIRGVAAGIDDLVYLHGAVGVSAGLVLGGRLVTGHGGHGGKVGHMVVHPHGRLCECGSRGCWDTEVGIEALLRGAGVSAGTSPQVVVRAAARGDIAAGHALHAVADWLGFGVANLVNLFNPDIVVFGGTLGEVYTAGAADVHRRLDAMALPASRKHLKLRASTLGADAPLIGAAELAFEHLLADPLKAPAAG